MWKLSRICTTNWTTFQNTIAKKHKLFSQMWVGGWEGGRVRARAIACVCERERERVLNFKAYITNSNNDRGAFILQQSLKNM